LNLFDSGFQGKAASRGRQSGKACRLQMRGEVFYPGFARATSCHHKQLTRMQYFFPKQKMLMTTGNHECLSVGDCSLQWHGPCIVYYNLTARSLNTSENRFIASIQRDYNERISGRNY